MLDGLSLDLLRMFVAAADGGSFSAAGRRVSRSQSVVSGSIAALEAQLRVELFNRTGRRPVLTADGRPLLAAARRVLQEVEGLKAKARELAGGLEPELAIVVDVLFPQRAMTETVRAFAEAFPDTPLYLSVETLGAAVEPVLQGRCLLGVSGSFPEIRAELVREPLLDVPLVAVAAPGSPLTAMDGAVPLVAAAEEVQLVLTDRSSLTEGRDFGVIGKRTWRLADLGAKHALLKAGLGWGLMPLAMVADDLAAGSLREVRLAGIRPSELNLPMNAIYHADRPPGVAGRWLIDRLRRAGTVGARTAGRGMGG